MCNEMQSNWNGTGMHNNVSTFLQLLILWLKEYEPKFLTILDITAHYTEFLVL